MRDASIVRNWESGNNWPEIIFSRRTSGLIVGNYNLILNWRICQKCEENRPVDRVFRISSSASSPSSESCRSAGILTPFWPQIRGNNGASYWLRRHRKLLSAKGSEDRHR